MTLKYNDCSSKQLHITSVCCLFRADFLISFGEDRTVIVGFQGAGVRAGSGRAAAGSPGRRRSGAASLRLRGGGGGGGASRPHELIGDWRREGAEKQEGWEERRSRIGPRPEGPGCSRDLRPRRCRFRRAAGCGLAVAVAASARPNRSALKNPGGVRPAAPRAGLARRAEALGGGRLPSGFPEQGRGSPPEPRSRSPQRLARPAQDGTPRCVDGRAGSRTCAPLHGGPWEPAVPPRRCTGVPRCHPAAAPGGRPGSDIRPRARAERPVARRPFPSTTSDELFRDESAPSASPRPSGASPANVLGFSVYSNARYTHLFREESFNVNHERQSSICSKLA
nr:translation initiation factor IF-2 [Oryctolagus cuniculus]